MRDVLLSIVIVSLLLVALRHPVVGVYLWAWLSLMNPHQLTFGFAHGFGFAQIVAIFTLCAVVVTSKRRAYPVTPITVVWLLFVAWMSFTCLFALNEPDLVFERWIFVIKIQVMMVATIVLVRSRAQLDMLIWVVTLSIAFFGIKGGVFTLLTGGGLRVWGPPGSMIEDNNALAIALVMVVPLMYYLYQTSSRVVTRWLLGLGSVAVFVSILGSQSRGALIAIAVMSFLLAVKSRHPVRMSAMLALFLAVGVAFMPDSWSDRMSTIGEYGADVSSLSRLYTWNTLWNLALDRPFVGGGLRSDALSVFLRYAPGGSDFDAVRGTVWVAHSIYFQALGEHGFVGLGLFLLLGVLTWRRAGQLARITRDDPEFGAWVPRLMPMVQVALVGYAVGGAFLSLAYFDLPYYLVGYVVLVDAIVRARSAVPTADAVPVLQGAGTHDPTKLKKGTTAS